MTVPPSGEGAGDRPDGAAADLGPCRDAGAATCSVCPHPAADHDRLAMRFCSATRTSAQSRGCICRPA